MNQDLSSLNIEDKRALLQKLVKAQMRQGRQESLTPGQTRLWQLQSRDPDSAVYNIAIAYDLNGPLDVPALEKAIHAVAERHESLRSTFSASGGDPVQVIWPDTSIHLTRTTDRGSTKGAWLHHVEDQLHKEASTPFELGKAPLVRFSLFERSPGEHTLLVTAHHIVCDRWSLGILARDIGALYSEFLAGAEPQIEPRGYFSDFARWQIEWLASGVVEEQLTFWSDRLGGPAPALELPVDRHPATAPRSEGRRRDVTIENKLASNVAALALREGVTTYVALLTGFCALLHEYTSQEDLIICLPVSGRHRPQSRGIVGYFNNILPLRVDLSRNPTFRELLHRVNSVVRATFEHQDVPFQQIAELPELALVPLTRCLFSLQNVLGLELELPGITSRYRDVPTGAADFDLALFLEEKGGTLAGFADYRADRFSDSRMVEITDRYLSVLANMTTRPEERVSPRSVSPTDVRSSETSAAESQRRTQQSAVPQPEGRTSSAVSGLPRNELERRLILIWEDLMRVRPISRDSNFFDLGGHSLLAARLFARIETLVGRPLPRSLLLQAPTIADLSQLLTQEEWAPSWSSLVPIKPDGSNPPLFLVHAGAGGILSYRRLARHLSEEQPVWGLQAPWHAEEDPRSRIEEIADHYISAVRSEQPVGPYFLGGHSFGAFIALEMAQRLRAQHEQVPLLVILDQAGPDAKPPGWIDLMCWHWDCMSQLEYRDRIRYVTNRVSYFIGKSRALPLPLRRTVTGALGRTGKETATLRLNQLQSALTAIESYRPQLYGGRMALIRGERSYARIHSDPLGGWGRIATGGIDVYDVPGDHMKVLEEPHVQVMAKNLTRAINRACTSTREFVRPVQ